jgi:predicted protein tyrosine phosphatase
MQESTATLRSVCGISELETHSDRSVTHVLSIMDPGWSTPAAFARYPAHHRLDLRFHDAIEEAPDVILPERRDVETILGFGARLAADHADRGDSHVLIHCHAGVSRSTAAMLSLITQAHPAEDEETLIARLVAIRPQAWPNLRMVGFADDLLGRDGRLVATLGRLYMRQLDHQPSLAEERYRQSRGREVEHARNSRGS